MVVLYRQQWGEVARSRYPSEKILVSLQQVLRRPPLVVILAL